MQRRLSAVLAADMVAYSSLMELDEEAVLARQKAHRREVIDPELARNRGRIVKTTGDGLLAEFASAQDAVRSAIDIQSEIARRERSGPEESRIRYRIGINLGDVIVDEGDIFGDGVNVAARLEGLAEPGGVCIADVVHQIVLDRLNAPFRDLGLQRVKNISRPIRIWQWTPDAPPEDPAPADAALAQQVRFCRSADGVQLAWAAIGAGPQVFKAPNWMNHIEYEWRSPIWGPLFAELARRCRLVRFDQRGNGLSDWEVENISVDAMTADMAAVADAAGLGSFVLLGISQGCAFSIRYAALHPERVRCLILLGGFARGRLRRGSVEDEHFHEVGRTMIREGWGSANPAYRSFFTYSFAPDATAAEAASFDELQRISTSPGNALRIWDMNAEVDVTGLCGQLKTPTLVLHCVGDRICPVGEGRLMASLIPGARFVALDGDDHAFTAGTPAFEGFIREVEAFLAECGD